MLPDFFNLKKEVEKRMMDYMYYGSKRDDFLSKIPEVKIFEGKGTIINTQCGHKDDSLFKAIKIGFKIKYERLIKEGIKYVKEELEKVAEKLKKAKSKFVFKKIDYITSQTGFRTKGRLNFTNYMKAIKMIKIEFDEAGKPEWPTLVLSPKMAKKFEKRYKKWLTEPVKCRKIEKVLSDKKKEWDAKESNRKLVE